MGCRFTLSVIHGAASARPSRRIGALEPMVPPAQDFLKKSDIRGPDHRKVRIACPHGPMRPLRGTFSRVAVGWHLVTIGPATDRIDRALDRRVVSHTNSRFQYASRRWCCSQFSWNSGMFWRRSNHVARQLSPTSAGSGGRHIRLKKKKAHSVRRLSETRRPYSARRRRTGRRLSKWLRVALSAGGRRAAI